MKNCAVQNMKGKKFVHTVGLQETYIINDTVNEQKVLLLDTNTQHWSSASATTTSSQQVLHSSRGQVSGSLRTVAAAVERLRVQCPTGPSKNYVTRNI